MMSLGLPPISLPPMPQKALAVWDSRGGGAAPLSGRSATIDDVKEREKEILALKKQIADAHNLCQVE